MESTQEYIDRLAEEVEKAYAAAVRDAELKRLASVSALEHLSRTLLGTTAGPAHAPAETPAPLVVPELNGVATDVERVLGAIAAKPKDANEIAEETGLPVLKVRAVLYSRFQKHRVRKVRRSGKSLKFVVKEKGKAQEPRARRASSGSNASTAVMNLLAEHPHGLEPSEILNSLADKIDSKAYNRRNTISSALYNLKKAKRVVYSEQSGRYYAAGTSS